MAAVGMAFFRRLITGVAILPLALGSAGAQVPAGAGTTVQPSHPWAQIASDVPADPALRFGTLSNGMRYVILHNATPPTQASLFLRIDAGSLMEKDDQLGLAHFMEHMAFNGTTHIPKNDLITILERLGLAFGADLNAATSFDETFYQLHLPRTNDETVDTALHVLREQVSEAVMKQEDIIGERGVIEGEERLRNTPSLRVSQKEMHLFVQGQKVADRFPIGDMRIIRTAPRQRFVDFYNAYYRPSRATLIAVGDFDVDTLEAKVKAKFADWQPKAPDGPNPDLGTVAPHGQETHIIVEPGNPASIALNWIKAPDLTPDTLAKRQADVVRELAIQVLNRRLGELSRTDTPPFIDAKLADANLVKSARIATLSAQFVPGHWQQALAAIDQEQRRFVQYGITNAELQREINATRTALTDAAARASTRNTRMLATEILNSVNENEVFISPQEELAIFEESAKGLTAAQVSEAIKPVFATGGPVTLLVSPTPIEGGEQALASAFQASRQVAVAAPVAPARKAWPYTDFGTPGTVQSRRELAQLGTTIVTFANGVTLTVKPTTFSKDQVAVEVLTGTGDMNFSPDRFDPLHTLVGGLKPGGLGKMTVDEMSRALNGHNVSASFNTLGDKFLLSGSTRPSDLVLQMQVLTAYLTDPAYRSAPFEKTKAQYPTTYQMALATPGGAFSLEAKTLLAGGDKREAFVPPETLEGWSMDDYRPQIRALLSSGPIHVTMVGDISVDDAIAATARTFGALPPRPEAPAPVPGADQRHFPAPTPQPLTFTHNGLAEQGLGYIAWPTTDLLHGRTEARRVLLLGDVLKLRVLAEIRERLALAYSPGVSSSFSDVYAGYGVLSAQAQTTPQKLPVFFKAMDGIVEKLRDKPVSQDELDRARKPLIESLQREMNTNGWWLNQLVYLVDRPDYANDMLTTIPDLNAVTPADIQALARKYLQPGKAWKAEVTPAAPQAVALAKPE